MPTSYYKCELHCHTLHSDGKMSPDTLARRAAERGLAAVALTDHNVTSGYTYLLSSALNHGITVIKGIEWTTFYGHVTALSDGVHNPNAASVVDWRALTKTNLETHARAARDAGCVLIIAHPRRVGAPVAIGCHFEFELSDYSPFSALEVW